MMKKSFLLLFATSVMLTGCGELQSVSKATINFNDGTSFRKECFK